MPLKHDSDAIEAHMRDLESANWIGASRAWWPRFLFRSDHVENAADILNRGELLSRAAAEANALIKKDSGSPTHIAQLAPRHRRLVRLYFRPRTPTQYVNEGFRPVEEIKYEAHMPVPVYLLFSSALLKKQGIYFSQGRLTANSHVGKSAEFLAAMDFRDIYNDGSVGFRGESPRRSEILNARHSEVLVQDRLSLKHLMHIVCRSGPERETLLNLLDVDARNRWERKVVEDDGRRRLFNRRGTFVSDVHHTEQGSKFTFHVPPNPECWGPYHLEIEWSGESQYYTYAEETFSVQDSPLDITLPDDATLSKYDVKLQLNDDVAYVGKFRRDDFFLEPF